MKLRLRELSSKRKGPDSPIQRAFYEERLPSAQPYAGLAMDQFSTAFSPPSALLSLKLFRSRSEPKGRNESDSDKENKDAAASCMRHAQVRLATMTMTHNTFSGRRPLETSEVTAAELRH